MKTYKELDVWKLTIELIVVIYNVTGDFPKTEQYGLVSQMRRAAVSIASNIAEGFGRKSKKDNARFIGMGYASSLELDTQLIISEKLGYVSQGKATEISGIINRVSAMLYRYRNYLAK